MAEPYEVEVGGEVYEVEADTPGQAATLARLLAARQQGGAQAEAGAAQRSEDPAAVFRSQLGRMGSFGAAPTQEDIAAGREANIPELTLGAMAAPALPTMLANPAALLKGLALSATGAGIGGLAGREVVGRGLEAAGLPAGTAKVTGALGGLAGGFAGPAIGAKALMGLAEATGARGTLLPLLRRIFPEAAEGAVGVASKEAASAVQATAEKEAAKAAERAAARQLAERRLAVAEERNNLLRMRLEGKAAPAPRVPKPVPAAEVAPEVASSSQVTGPSSRVAVPASTGIPEPAADTATIVLKLQQQMGSTSGRKVVQELLAKMPPEEASVIRTLLKRGQAHPASWSGKLFDPTKPLRVNATTPGEELARLLGQVR